MRNASVLGRLDERTITELTVHYYTLIRVWSEEQKSYANVSTKGFERFHDTENRNHSR